MRQVTRRLVCVLVVATLAGGALAPSASAYPRTRNCATVTLSSGGTKSSAFGIRATGYGCRSARRVVRLCLRDRLRGWRVSRSPSPDDRSPKGLIGLDRRSAHISFQVRGRSGCA